MIRNALTDWLSQFFDKPVVVIISGILTVAWAAFVLFSKTSFGKKAIKSLTSLADLTAQKANDTLKKVEEVETLAKEKIAALQADYEEKAEKLKTEYETKVACVVSIFNYNEERLFAILEKIPNAKVQDELIKFKKGYEEKKKEITEVIGLIYEDYNKTVEEIEEKVREEYKEKVAFLEEKLKELSLYVNEIKPKEESEDGEREESINSDPTGEEVQESI